MNRAAWWATLGTCAVGVAANAFTALTGVWFAAGIAAVLTGLAAGLVRAFGSLSRLAWTIASIITALLGIAAYSGDLAARSDCTTNYDGRRVITGTELTETARRARSEDSTYTNEKLLFDAAGSKEDVWTAESIRNCERRLTLFGTLWIPLFASALICAIGVAGSRWKLRAPAQPPPGPSSHAALRYDAFISYRHGGEDGEFARNLVQELEAAGFRLAIDERDFRAEQSFLQEMERCIRESRFTLALISARFLESGNTEEEALITKILDMGERKRRLVPLILQRVEMPVWMYGIVGIDFTAEAGMVSPIEKLKATLGVPLAKAGTID